MAAGLSQFGTPKTLPTGKEMAQAVSEATGQTIMLDVYDRLYEPLSMMFAHSGPMALLRHVDPRGRVVHQPMKPWTDRAALRTADACVGILASCVADQSGVPSDDLVSYGNSHWQRTLLPMLVIFGRSARASANWAELRGALRDIGRTGRYYRSEQAAADTAEVREARIRQSARRFFDALVPAIEPDLLNTLVEALVKELAESVPPRPDYG
jgi:hypothetical protein